MNALRHTASMIMNQEVHNDLKNARAQTKKALEDLKIAQDGLKVAQDGLKVAHTRNVDQGNMLKDTYVKIDKLQHAHNKLVHECEELKQDAEEMTKKSEKQQETIAQLTNTVWRRNDARKEDLKDVAKVHKKALDLAIKEGRDQTDKAALALRKNHGAVMKQLKATHAAATDALTKQHTAAMQEKDAALGQMKQEKDTALEQMKQEKDTALEEMKQALEHATEMKNIALEQLADAKRILQFKRVKDSADDDSKRHRVKGTELSLFGRTPGASLWYEAVGKKEPEPMV